MAAVAGSSILLMSPFTAAAPAAASLTPLLLLLPLLCQQMIPRLGGALNSSVVDLDRLPHGFRSKIKFMVVIVLQDGYHFVL